MESLWGVHCNVLTFLTLFHCDWCISILIISLNWCERDFTKTIPILWNTGNLVVKWTPQVSEQYEQYSINNMIIHVIYVYTVEPPISDHPKCQAKWSLTGGGRLWESVTTECLNFVDSLFWFQGLMLKCICKSKMLCSKTNLVKRFQCIQCNFQVSIFSVMVNQQWLAKIGYQK